MSELVRNLYLYSKIPSVLVGTAGFLSNLSNLSGLETLPVLKPMTPPLDVLFFVENMIIQGNHEQAVQVSSGLALVVFGSFVVFGLIDINDSLNLIFNHFDKKN